MEFFLQVLSTIFYIICIPKAASLEDTYAIKGQTALFSWTLVKPLPVSGEAFSVLNPQGQKLFITAGTSNSTSYYEDKVNFNSYSYSGQLSFSIRNVGVENAGVYSVRYKAKTHSGQRLYVLGEPVISNVKNETGLLLICSVIPNVTGKDHQLLYHWYWDEILIQSSGRYHQDRFKLYVTNVTAEDDGSNITCSISLPGRFVSNESSAFFVRSKCRTPKAVIHEIHPPMTNTRLELSCFPYLQCDESFQISKYRWKVRGRHNNTDSTRYLKRGSVFIISNISNADDGTTIQCLIDGVGGKYSRISETYVIHSLYGPKEVTLSKKKGTYYLRRGETSFDVACSASCNPPCDFYWNNNNSTDEVVAGNKLSFHSFQTIRFGIYYCTAYNNFGSSVSEMIELILDEKEKTTDGEHFKFNVVFGTGTGGGILILFAVIVSLLCRQKRKKARRKLVKFKLKEISKRLKEAEEQRQKEDVQTELDMHYHTINSADENTVDEELEDIDSNSIYLGCQEETTDISTETSM